MCGEKANFGDKPPDPLCFLPVIHQDFEGDTTVALSYECAVECPVLILVAVVVPPTLEGDNESLIKVRDDVIIIGGQVKKVLPPLPALLHYSSLPNIFWSSKHQPGNACHPSILLV